MDGMVSICDPSVNVVTHNRPEMDKMLKGLTKLVTQRVRGLPCLPSWAQDTLPTNRGDLNRNLSSKRNVSSPYSSPATG